MAHETNLFTTSVSWGGKETLDYFLKAHYTGKDPLNTPGIMVRPNVPGKENLNVFGVTGKKTKAYAAGFSGSTGDTYTQKVLYTYDMKAEAAYSAAQFRDTIYKTAAKMGVSANDVENTPLGDILAEAWIPSMKSDMFRQVWLNDTAKTTVSGGYWTATADTNYNAYNGIIKSLRTDAATTAPSASGTHIYRKAMDHGAVAQKTTITITTLASGGTDLVLTVNGVSYTTTYTSSMNATAALFVTNHATTILAKHHITVTNPSGAAIVFEAADAGVAHVITVASASDVTASGGVVATTANTAPSALAADEALTYMRDLYDNSYAELTETPDSEKTYYVDSNVWSNLLESFEDGGTYTELGKSFLINGIQQMTYRGIPVIKIPINQHIAADFPANYYDEGLIILSKNDNIIIGINGDSKDMDTQMHYEWKDEQNLIRTRYEIGVIYLDNKLTAISY